MGEPEWPPDLFELFSVFVADDGARVVDGDGDFLGLHLRLLLLRSRLGLTLASESNGVRRSERS